MRNGFLGCLIGVGLVLAAVPAASENLWDKVKKGAQDTGKAIGEGAGAVGDAIGKGVESVGESISSTDELLSNEETPEATRARLDAMSDSILARLLAENAQAAALYENSAGYAAFDSRKVTIFPVTTGYGRGVAVSQPGGARIYMNMTSGGLGAGLGIGGFATQFVILFETPADFKRFVTNGYDATAGGGAQAGRDVGEERAHFTQGQSVFALGKDAWKVNASLEGTKYWRSPELN